MRSGGRSRRGTCSNLDWGFYYFGRRRPATHACSVAWLDGLGLRLIRRDGFLCQNGFSQDHWPAAGLWPWDSKVVVSASGADCSSEIQDNLHPSISFTSRL